MTTASTVRRDAARSEVPPGMIPISADQAYPLPLFTRGVGLKRHGMREARRNGLRVVHLHGRAYVLGRDWIAYLDRQATAETATI